MDFKKFSKNFQVHYYGINGRQQATPITLLQYLEETAISHSESVGYGINRLKSEGIGWILNRWSLIIDCYPLWNDEVVVETWPSNMERFYASREFYIKGNDGCIIGRASSLWIFLDIEKKRPRRIPVELEQTYGLEPSKAIENPFTDLKNSSNTQPEKSFSVRRSDIDTNGHVNNTRYIEWALEAVPEDVHRDFSLTSLEIEYKKETTLGDVINSCYVEEQNDMQSVNFNHSIRNSADGTELASARTVWKRTRNL